MNPFSLPDTQFLVFYLVFATLVIGATHYWRVSHESGPLPRLGTTDPYLIAYLRGGANEALCVVIMSLLDRGLLIPKARRRWFWKSAQPLLQAQTEGERRATRALERAILREFASPAVPDGVFSSHAARAACDVLKSELHRHGLLPGVKQVITRAFLGIGCAASLCWVASTKIELAAAEGRHDFLMLQSLQDLALFATLLILCSRTTALGSRLLRNLRVQFLRLRRGSRVILAASARRESGLLMGVFGMEALSGSALARARELFPQAVNRRRFKMRSTSDATVAGDFNSSESSSPGEGGECAGGSDC